MNASAILATLARRLPRRGNGSLSREAVPPFYLYDEPRLRFEWLLACERIIKLRHTSAWERFAEVQLTRLLERHPPLPCVCAREEPKYWWSREREVSGWLLKRWPRINRGELGGMSSVELCRCAHCGKTCSM